MNVTIVGSGNSGLIHAAKIFEKGYPVGVLKTSDYGDMDFFNSIAEKSEYDVVDLTNNGNTFKAKMQFITRDVKMAIDFADIIMVMTTTSQHEHVAELIAPYVRDGQLVVLCPGYMGSLIFKKYIKADVVYSEWETTAFNGRIVDGSFVRITFYNPRNAISVLPVCKADEVLNKLSQLFDNTKYLRRHILESALHNPNMIVHPIGIIFSASRIEHSGGEFWMYREAFTPSVVRVIQEFDKHKNKILEAFGCEPLDYFEAAKWRNAEDLSIPAMDVFRSFADSSNKGPSVIDHRYLNEDVPMGLGLYISIGKVLGYDTSIQESILTLASALLGKNLKTQSRTIQYLLGRDEVTVDDIKQAIH